jgi:hypothetical protein
VWVSLVVYAWRTSRAPKFAVDGDQRAESDVESETIAR